MLKNKKSSFFKTFINSNYGIGTGKGIAIFQNIGLNTRIQSSILKRKQTNELSKKVQKIVCGKKLKDHIKNTISFLSKNKTYKGIRHKLKYPARGQRTHTNAKTKKKFKY
jgi:small subunit ribosomal protein S13